MNKPLTDAELQDRMMTYNAKVIDTISAMFQPTPIAIRSEEDIRWSRERKLQQQLFSAIGQLKAAIHQVNSDSEVMSINIGGFDDWQHDEGIIDPEFWNHKIRTSTEGQ